ncbi:hypothetical protein AB0C52_34910 [Streptomyces sp. NPDC048717]|uniref:hypothetical protein n=1 Tax=Streptomyces sp. NPDC048717 TaxID=3154928 RepID=UPI0034220D5F
MTFTLTPYSPRMKWGLWGYHPATESEELLSPAALRQMATGESDETVAAEMEALADRERVVPTATVGQARGEARIFQALMNAYGRHRSTTTGGPFGIRSITPRPSELVILVAPAQLPRWADALGHSSDTQGVAGLRWAPHEDGIVLMLEGMKLVLAETDEATWRTALRARTVGQGGLEPYPVPVPVAEAERAKSQDAELASIADLLSATLRRIHLVGRLTGNANVHLFTTRYLDQLYLIEACVVTPTVRPLWITQCLPLALWPTGRMPAGGPADPYAAVLDLLIATEPFNAPPRAAHNRPALALCHLAGRHTGRRFNATFVEAAEHVLAVAARVLADPAHANLYDAGGWAGGCRTFGRGAARRTDPCVPPGAEEVMDLPEADLIRFGAQTQCAPDSARRIRAGRDLLVGMLGWALAAATRADNRLSWTREGFLGVQRATHPLPGREGTLNLRAVEGHIVELDIHGLPGLTPEDGTVYWEGGDAPSQAVGVLLAEHAAIEASVCLPFQRTERKHRLLLPVPGPARPTIRAVAAGADGDLGFITLATYIAEPYHREVHTYGAADGHWQRLLAPEDTESSPDPMRTLTAHLSDWHQLPSPNPGEEANTASVDSPLYLRFLAAHRSALDPFVTLYLAAADSLRGLRTFEERHRAGAAALRFCNPLTVACQGFHPVREPLLRMVKSIPEDPGRLEAWYAYYLGELH